ncbi:MAG: 2'-5' RNA ligase [Flavobacteriales bacterium]
MKLSLIADLSIPVVERIVLLQEDLDDPLHYLNVDVTWFPAERIRLTLCDFRGDIDAARMRLLSELSTLVSSHADFSVRTVGAEYAPSESRPRLAIVRHEPHAGLLALREAACALGAELALTPDDTPWSPVTAFGRIKGPSDRLQGVLRPYQDTPFGESNICELLLVSSQVRRGRAESRVERRFSLSPSPSATSGSSSDPALA